MMNKKTKTTLQFILAAVLLTSFAIAGCNNSGDSKEAAKDSPAVEKSMEATPVAPPADDSMSKKPKDTASTRPTPGGSKQ
jgi:hypothetical protein